MPVKEGHCSKTKGNVVHNAGGSGGSCTPLRPTSLLVCLSLTLPGVTLRVYKPVTGDGDIFLPTKPLGNKEVSRV